MFDKRHAFRHPIRDGLGFLAAAATALVQLFAPPRQAPPEVDGDAPDAAEATPLKARVAPYPVED